MYERGECSDYPEPIIADIPALSPDGSGSIEVTSADMALPCVGVFSERAHKALFIFTEQECRGKNIGFKVRTGCAEVQFPAMRSRCYRMCTTEAISSDSGIEVLANDRIGSRVIIREFECESLSRFFEFYLENRRILLSDGCAKTEYTGELWNILEEHMNRDNYSGEYYAEISKVWQAGWVGGGMSSLPLMMLGTSLSRTRAMKTVDFLTSHASAQGFFYGMIKDGAISDDGFGREHMKGAMLTRKNGDALYFLFKHFDIAPPKPEWVEAARGCADAFVRLYEKYESFGQFVDLETGRMLFGGTASGASVIGALVRAWRYFNDERYLGVAKRSGESYYKSFVAKGVTYGGPGEALCAPDSESAYAMTESMTLLYEATGDCKWLAYAEDSLRLFSTWVMPYAYKFPEGSEFARLKINTVGSVFANAQNKHSAPGICTASGDAIYKIYKYTGKVGYLDLLRDIVYFIPQCVSTKERPIYSWDDDPVALTEGYICERVNTSDWESARRVGAVFNASCWPETSLLLTYSEIIYDEEISAELKA
jgi:hypothetical protein